MGRGNDGRAERAVARDARACDDLVYELHLMRGTRGRRRLREDVVLVREAIVTELRLRRRERHCRLCDHISSMFLMASLLETVHGEG